MNNSYSLENVLEAQNSITKWVTKILNKVIEKIYNNTLDESNIDEFRDFSRKFTGLYYIMKDKFEGINRSSWERYFEHLREVVENVLELPNPNMNKVLVALAHDSIEDTNITYETLSDLYGHEVALAVQAISKDSWEDYQEQWDSQKEAKTKRNVNYFGHMESFDTMKSHIKELASKKWVLLSEQQLTTITQDTIDVKLADRIHNLSTQWNPNKLDWVQRKVDETKQYFLPLAKQTNTVAYEKLKSLVLALEIQLHNAAGSTQEILDN